MLRALSTVPAGCWDNRREIGTITLGWDDRHRRRIRLETDAGDKLLLDLPRAARLNEGDGLVLEDDRIVRIVAAAEPVLIVQPGTATLARLAYHLGNRHLPVEIRNEALILRDDHVIAEMLLGLGAIIARGHRPFSPEPGAYGGGHAHADDHDHDHAHDHDHNHDP